MLGFGLGMIGSPVLTMIDHAFVPGVVLGPLAVAAWSDRVIAFAVAASVVPAEVASAATARLRPDRRTVLVPGGASAFMGTTTGVGGPATALTYQHGDPRVMRASLAAFFTIGAVMSVAGLLASRVLNRLVDADRARPVILAACELSALVLLAQQLV